MDEKQFLRVIQQVNFVLKSAFIAIFLLLIIVSYLIVDHFPSNVPQTQEVNEKLITPKVVNGIHIETGLVDGQGLNLVIQNCTSCHSAKLITQNRMNLEGWKSTIQWMQETQNLWDLGASEKDILDYLASNYAPTQSGRRKNLGTIDWYRLEQ